MPDLIIIVARAQFIPDAIFGNDRGPEHLRWFWALHFPSKPENLRTDNRVATLEEAKAQFQKCWDAWKAWAKMEEVP
jgi:hypothetical protein